jgi:hypothetical protein
MFILIKKTKIVRYGVKLSILSNSAKIDTAVIKKTIDENTIDNFGTFGIPKRKAIAVKNKKMLAYDKAPDQTIQ